MIFKGYNHRVDPSDLEDGESPDTLNCAPYKDVVGTLGPRSGRTFFNSTAYSTNSNGLMSFNIGGNRYLVVSGSDGTLTQINAPLPSLNTPEYDDGTIPSLVLATPLSISHASPDEDETYFQLWENGGALVGNPSGTTYLAVPAPTVSFTGEVDSAFNFSFEIGLCNASGAQTGGFPTDLVYRVGGALGQTSTFTYTPSDGAFLPFELGANISAYGVCIRVVSTWVDQGAVSGTITLSGINRAYLIKR